MSRVTNPPAPPPASWKTRQQFQTLIASLRLQSRELAEGDPNFVLEASWQLALALRWPTVDDVATELANALGVGWGAAYRMWAHGHIGCTCPVGWVSYSEVGPHPTPECPVHEENSR
ncbi:hypothetical protein CRM73_00325 [Kocuria sp. CCUG 69068]|nr:hypothetical protein [Kocuria sp. CCUG 69068]